MTKNYLGAKNMGLKLWNFEKWLFLIYDVLSFNNVKLKG